MLDIEQILRDEAAALEEAVSERSVPSFRPPRVRRWPKVVVPLAAAAVLVAVIAGVVVTRSDDNRRVATIPTPPPPTSTEAPTTTVARTTTVPPANPFPTGAPLETIAETGGPIALSHAPEGYVPVMTHEQPGPGARPPLAPPGESPPPERHVRTWVAFDGDVPVADRNLDLTISPLEAGATPYGITELNRSPEQQYGAWIGKIGVNDWTGRWYFAGALGTDRQIWLIGMGFDLASFEDVVEGLAVQPDGDVEATTIPAGFRLMYDAVDRGSEAYAYGYSVTYAKEQAMEGSLSLTLTLGQTRPAELALLRDQGVVLRFDDRYGIRWEDGMLFDLSPGVQVSISIGWIGGDQPQVSSDYLIELARSVVALSPEEWASLRQYTSERPFRPVDMPCSGGPITFSELVTDSPTLEPLGEFAIFGPGATFSVTGTVERPTELTINARNPWDGTLIPLATEMVDGPTPFTVTWDGTINGEAAPPGYYWVQVTGTFTAEQNGGPCVTNDFEQGNLIKALYYIE